MKKKLLTCMVALGLCLCLTACAQTQETGNAPEESQPVDGGWALVDNEAAKLPKDVQAAFKKAMKNREGAPLKPVAFLATQVVAGTNFMLLCEEEKPEIAYKMVIVYEDLNGEAALTHEKDFPLTAYIGGESKEVNQEELAGGWSVADDWVGTEIPEDAKTAFDKAVKDFTGSTLEPMALLGTQVVAGMNRAFLCYSLPGAADPVPGIQVVTVYTDPQGKAEVTGLANVDPADFN